MKIAILFARADSIYKTLPDCDVWDAARDARKWPGGSPLVAHPPCRMWGRMRGLAGNYAGEKELAIMAVDLIRQEGGILEHPAWSTLWQEAGLPTPGSSADQFGGWTLPIVQYWFGHPAQKATWLYIVGCSQRDIPKIPLVLGSATQTISTSSRNKNGTRRQPGEQGYRSEVSRDWRERTPYALAVWLVEVAKRCKKRQ